MTVTRLMTVLGIAVAAVVALAIPVSYYAISVGGAKQSLRIETAAVAHDIEDIVRDNPEMWEYQSMRLLELASQPPVSGDPEERIVHDISGREIVRTAYQARFPIVGVTVPIYDSGQRVGSVEGRRSVAPILGSAALMAVAGLLAGLSVFIVYRSWPIRILDRTLAQLSGEKKKSDTTLQAIADGVITVDSDGRIVLINRVAERLLGWPSEGAIGKPLEEVYVVRRETEPRMGRMALRTILQSEDGVEHLIEEARSPVPEEGGREGCVIVFRDVTERTRIQDELLRGRQIESIGLLAAGIAHDFNNFLTGILGNLSLARLHADGHPKALERLEEAERATLRARELAQKLLTLAKGGEEARRTVVDAAVLTSEAARFAARGTAVKTQTEAPAGLWSVEADPGQITQVVNNIVLNAVQAIDGRGTIRIGLSNAEIVQGQVRHVRPGRYVVIRIEDSGPGIHEAILPRIFEPYFTTKADGTGLGLATCYNIMKAHGGNIFADSRPGRGAAFTLYLPATDRLLPGDAAAAPAGPLPAGLHGRILVMDDEALIRDLAREFLTHLGYDVSLSENGEQAVEEYSRAEQDGRRYDAVILDLTIPGGMGGQEAARTILSRFPSARLIVSSGYSNHPVIVRPADYGFRGAVTKPYRIEDMGRVVKAVVEGPADDGATA